VSVPDLSPQAGIMFAGTKKTFLPVIYRFLYKARVFVRLDWKSSPMTNTLLITEIRNLRTKKFYKVVIALASADSLKGQRSGHSGEASVVRLAFSLSRH